MTPAFPAVAYGLLDFYRNLSSQRMSDRSSIFDMIGPVMIGPSSSHTAGVVRIGRVARRLIGKTPKRVVVTFYNSFATTFEGHGSDRAILAGLLDYQTDDDRIREALQHAQAAGMTWDFRPIRSSPKHHPNSVKIEMWDENEDNHASILGVSRGGGLIMIAEVDGLHVQFTADDHTLIIDAQDKQGSVSFISSVVAMEGCNIGTMTVARRGRQRGAKLVLEKDHGLRQPNLNRRLPALASGGSKRWCIFRILIIRYCEKRPER